MKSVYNSGRRGAFRLLARFAGLALALLIAVSIPPGAAVAQQARDAEFDGRVERMSRVGRAVLTYHDKHKCYPVAGKQASHFDASGSPHLSWRVHILPELGYQKLYDRFHLDEAWDSEHNLKLLDAMPEEYRTVAKAPRTTLLALRSDPKQRIVTAMTSRTFGGKVQPPRIRDIVDGTVYTILVAEVSQTLAAPWTKPVDATYAADKPLPKLGRADEPNVLVLNAAGQVLEIPRAAPEEVWRALMTRNEGTPVAPKWVKSLKPKQRR